MHASSVGGEKEKKTEVVQTRSTLTIHKKNPTNLERQRVVEGERREGKEETQL
jgi:hypothetical protein